MTGSVERVGGDSCANAQREPRVCEPVRENAADSSPQRLCRVGAGSRQHYDEFVASEPSRFSAVGEHLYEDAGDLVQERVAELVTGTVVDLLEVVAVDHEKAYR